jgi:hypothetical protein
MPPIRQDDPFTTYKFSEEEISLARQLSPEQRCYYQTLMADAAQEKIGMMYDPYKQRNFLQQEAYLRGQIDILNMILSEGTIVRPRNAVVPADTFNSKPDITLDPRKE